MASAVSKITSHVSAATSGEAEVSSQPVFRLQDRNSLELVIAFTAPVGSGATTVCGVLQKLLEEEFQYEVHYIKVSSIIRQHAAEVDSDLGQQFSAQERFDEYQTAGNRLRNLKPTYLADRAIEMINALRREYSGVRVQENAPDIAIQKRSAYIIDSLKNPEEVKRLRQVYGDLFWHITVFAPEQVREKRLVENGVEETSVKHIMKRDEREGAKTGQQVSKTAHLADYFIRNHTDVIDNVRDPVLRFLDTIFGTKLFTPTNDESGMMKAASAAVRSACLSRQVGAAIYSAESELIGVGCNDVPKTGGGLYNSDMPEGADKRCYKWGGKKCHNDDHKFKLASSISRKISPDDDPERNRVFGIVAESESRNLIEFSRSVHDEMEAIVSVARTGKGSTLNATIFTTTFPCHNCARHIIAAGIKRVVYIEPYSKSLALDLHSDAVTLVDESDKVHFVQYEGFAPRSSLRVFSSTGRERKDGFGKFVEAIRREASPLFPHPLDSYMSSEELVIQELANLQGDNDGETQGNRE